MALPIAGCFLVSADKANRTLADSHVRESCPHLRNTEHTFLIPESSNIYEGNQLGIKTNSSRQAGSHVSGMSPLPTIS